ISRDSVASHQGFIEKFGLKFPLLSDSDAALAKALGSDKNPVFLLRMLGWPARDTFLVDPQGTIVKVWRNVSPDQTVNVAFEELKKRAS
ncbi:MAG: redoxin domain-containing protein, partial [Spirochaetia bacterium]|nr:redoxin domain-containing protein [Spirochaetia bacterium]